MHTIKAETENNLPAGWRKPQRLTLWLSLGLIGAVAAAFWPVLQAGFVDWDDRLNILDNPHLGLSWDNVCWMFTDVSYAKRYLPLGWLSYSIDRSFFGGSALSYHLGNLILHAANAVLLFAILRRVFQAATQDQDKHSALISWGAAAGAAWWALNPLRAEPVAWASSRIYCAASLFYFLSLLTYLRGGDEGSRDGKRQVWLASFFFGLSLFTYPIALGGVALFTLMDLFLLRRLPLDPRQWLAPQHRGVWAEKGIFLIPIAVTFGANYWARINHPQVYPVVSLDQFSVGARLMQAFWVWAWYLWKPFLPLGLSPKYPDLLTDTPFTGTHVIAAILVCGITLGAFWRRKRWPGLLAVWLCHLALVLPFTGVTEHPHFTYDRYSYMPGVIWAVAIAFLGLRLFECPGIQKRLHAAGAVLLLAGLGWLAQQQARIWNNSLSVQSRMAESLGDFPERAQHNVKIATYLLEGHREREAEAEVRKALSVQPKMAVAWVVLGDVLCEQKRVDDAITSYQRALELDPEVSSGRQSLGVAFAMAKRYEESAGQFREVLRRNPQSASAHHNLALALHSLGREDEARQHLREFQRLKATNDKAL